MSFSSDELVRYQRHLSLQGFGPEAQEKLKAGSVLVIGAGGLGCPVLLYLAAAGVGRITFVDDDRVDVSNLQRQVLFTGEDAGQPKVEAAERRLRALNPFITIQGISARFTRNNALELVREHDVVIDASDNFGTRYLVNDACVMVGKPFVSGAIQGFEGQISVFNWQGGPTYRCLFPEPPPAGSVPSCAEAGVLGVLPGLIGTAQANEAIKLLTGIGQPLSGRLLMWDALNMTTQTLTLAVDPNSRSITELPPEGYGQTCGLATNSSADDPDEITANELRANVSKFQLIDVRETWERELGAIQSSVHIPLAWFDDERLPPALAGLNPDQPTVLYCVGGVRSLKALMKLRERIGFNSARSLQGGFKAWSK